MNSGKAGAFLEALQAGACLLQAEQGSEQAREEKRAALRALKRAGLKPESEERALWALGALSEGGADIQACPLSWQDFAELLGFGLRASAEAEAARGFALLALLQAAEERAESFKSESGLSPEEEAAEDLGARAALELCPEEASEQARELWRAAKAWAFSKAESPGACEPSGKARSRFAAALGALL